MTTMLKVLVLLVVLSAALVNIDGLSMSLTGKALIIQNKGGGHGTIGYYLAKKLVSNNPNLKVAILQDKCNYAKPPFSSYEELKSMGVEIVDTMLSEAEPSLGSIQDFQPTYVIDNWSKGTANATFVSKFAESNGCEQLVFVSSAGMYDNGSTEPQTEENSVKVNPVRESEVVFSKSKIPFTFMRPQYIYGPKSAKKYLDYFIGRSFRNLPIPIPNKGNQFVCLTHIEDIASLIAASVGNDKAKNEIFNCGTNTYVGYKELCDLVRKELGSNSETVSYDPKVFKKCTFPFRPNTFVTTPAKAMKLLDWTPKFKLQDDIPSEVAAYKSSSDASIKWDTAVTEVDREIISAAANA